jgi:hypothetical protein
LDLWPLNLPHADQTVPGNKQFVAETISYDLKPSQNGRDHDCVEPIDGEIVHSLPPGKGISIAVDKAAIDAQFCDGAAGFNSSERVILSVLLVLDCYRRLTEYSGRVKVFQRDSRQPQSEPGKESGAVRECAH